MHAIVYVGLKPSTRLCLPSWLDYDRRRAVPIDVHGAVIVFGGSDARVVAKRKVVHFGWDYGYDSWTISPTEPIPEWLMPFTTRAAGVMGVRAVAVQEVLVTRYAPGAGIG